MGAVETSTVYTEVLDMRSKDYNFICNLWNAVETIHRGPPHVHRLSIHSLVLGVLPNAEKSYSHLKNPV